MSDHPSKKTPNTVLVNGIEYLLNGPTLQRVSDTAQRAGVTQRAPPRLPMVVKQSNSLQPIRIFLPAASPLNKTGQAPASGLHKIQPATSQLNITQSLPAISQLNYSQPISNVSHKPTSTQSASNSTPTHLGTSANIKQVYIIQQPFSGPNNSQSKTLKNADTATVREHCYGNSSTSLDAPAVVSITAQSEEITTSQSETSKSGPKWKPAEVDLLISCYRRFKPRFDKKNETEKKIWGELAELMKSNGVIVTGERCSVKWKSMKERYNEISDKLKKVKEGTQTSGRRSQWPFFAVMDEILGQSDTTALPYVFEVGAGGKMKKANTNEPFIPAAKRSRQKITNSESLDRLIDLEEDRRERDKDLIDSIKSQNQSSKDKNDAIIAAAKAMEQASMAIFRKFSQD